MDKYDAPVFTALVEISRLANSLQSVMDMGMADITSRQRRDRIISFIVQPDPQSCTYYRQAAYAHCFTFLLTDTGPQQHDLTPYPLWIRGLDLPALYHYQSGGGHLLA